MNWLNPSTWFQRSAPTTTLSDPAKWMLDIWSPPSSSGVRVNSKTALTHTAVWAAIKVLSESIASLPLHLYQRIGEQNTEIATAHPVERLISMLPSGLYNSFTFRQTLIVHLCLRGNAYAYIERNGNMRPTSLTILPPDRVCPFVYNGKLYYDFVGDKTGGTLQSKRHVFEAYEILHLRGMSMDGIEGMSPIQYHRETVGMGIASRDFAANTFKSGTATKFVLLHPNKLDKEQMQTMREQWVEKFGGSANAGKPPILERGMDIKPISLTPEDAQYIATAKLTKEDIGAIFRVPSHLTNNLDRATFNNIEHLSQDFVTNTLRPIVRNLEEEMNCKLLYESEKGTFFHRHNFEGMLRGDSKARADFYTKMFQIGVLSQNDIRGLENMNAIDGGDRYFVPLNMIDSEKAGEITGDPKGLPQTDTDNEQQEASEA